MMLLRRRNMMGAAKSLEGALGSLAVGTLVTLKGVGNFIVVHQGNPNSSLDNIYDVSCNGTWLWLEDVYLTTRRFDASSNNYPESDIAQWLNETYANFFHDYVKQNLKTVKIPYYDADADQRMWAGNGFQCKAFLPAAMELAFYAEDFGSWGNAHVAYDGLELSYFSSIVDNKLSHADEKRAASKWYWMRTPYKTSANNCFLVNSSGAGTYRTVSSNYGVRPMIIMDKYTPIDGDEIAIVE